MTQRVEHPIAVVGMAGLFPGAASLDALWSAVLRAESKVTRAARFATDAYAPGGGEDLSGTRALAVLEPFQVELARYGIPPAQGVSIARVQLLMLEVVDRCLADAGYRDREFPRDRTDVICGTCFGFDRTYANALRVESAAVVARFLELLRDLSPTLGDPAIEAVAKGLRDGFRARFGGAAHDRVGEMASTIPARISIAQKLRGRCLSVESADATSFVALEIAMRNLRQREADLAIVAAAQLYGGPLVQVALDQKSLLSAEPSVPFARDASGYSLGEGVVALLLKRLEDAERDGDEIACVLAAGTSVHTSRRGTFRYSTSASDRKAAILAACRAAGWAPASVQYVEAFGSALPAEASLEIEAIADAIPGAPTLGSVKAVLGHGFAVAGLESLVKVALALRHRTIPGQGPVDALPHPRLSIAEHPRPWAANGGDPRRALITGASLTGTFSALLVEEHREGRARVEVVAPKVPAIAIVGLGGVFPDAPDSRAFWRNIEAKHDPIRELPDSVVDKRVYFQPGNLDVFKTYTVVGAKLDRPALPSDGPKILPRRADQMDDAQKLALIAARETFESFGFPAAALPAGRAAVLMASSLCLNAERAANNRLEHARIEGVITESPAFRELNRVAQARVLETLEQAAKRQSPPIGPFALDGFLASGIAAAISNEWELGAVPIAVEAACASSMAALDVAVRGLAARDWDFAVAGGVELPANVRDLVICSSLRLLSTERITPFDARADGFSVGEGIAMFALERLDDALAAGHRVYAVLRGLGASSDAKSLIAPDGEGQALAMRRAFEQVDFSPSCVQYIETHGTGTTIGDVIEAKAIKSVYQNGHRATPLALGSVKSMVGHTFAAAGAVGLMKTVLALEHGRIPPNIALRELNPKLELGSIPAYVSTESAPWPRPSEGPRRAAVSAMGTGGINFHLLVEEAPAGRS